MGLGVEDFSRVVSRLYGAPGRSDVWRSAFDELTHVMDATACTLVASTAAEPLILATTISAEADDAYRSYYHQLDFVVNDTWRGPVGLVRGGYDLVARHRHTEFHADWQRRHDMTDGLHVRLAAPTPTSFVVSAPPGPGPYATAERVRFVDALLPHLQATFDTHQRLAVGGHQPESLRLAAETSRRGVIVVGVGGRIVTMNTPARDLASRRDGLRVIAQRVRIDRPDSDAELQAAVAQAVGPRPTLGVRVGREVVCERPSRGRPYVLRIQPLDTDVEPVAGLAAVIVTDPDRPGVLSKTLLRSMFGLTNTEADVAVRMFDGVGIPAISHQMGLSPSTVRTHAHNVFTKTRTRRQAELVRLLAAIAT